MVQLQVSLNRLAIILQNGYTGTFLPNFDEVKEPSGVQNGVAEQIRHTCKIVKWDSKTLTMTKDMATASGNKYIKASATAMVDHGEDMDKNWPCYLSEKKRWMMIRKKERGKSRQIVSMRMETKQRLEQVEH